MGEIADIRTAIAAAINGINDLRASATWPDIINCPAAAVMPESGDYDQDFSGGYTPVFELTILVAPAGSISRAQDKLDPYLDRTGANSIKAAIEADPTLGGKADYAVVKGWHTYEGLELPGLPPYLAVKFRIEVIL